MLSYSTESEDIVRNLLQQLLDKVHKHDEDGVEGMVRSILMSIINCRSSTEIAEEIIGKVSFQLTNEQRASIDDAAKELYKIQEPDVCYS